MPIGPGPAEREEADCVVRKGIVERVFVRMERQVRCPEGNEREDQTTYQVFDAHQHPFLIGEITTIPSAKTQEALNPGVLRAKESPEHAK